MAKEESTIKLEGRVAEVLPGSMYRVKLENEAIVLAHASGKMKQNHIRVLEGDRVDVEVSMYDMTRGRLTFRYRD